MSLSGPVSRETPSAAELVAELRSHVCQCGRPKRSGHSVCHRCFCRLEPRLRRALYLRIGEGYEAAYAASRAVLAGEANHVEGGRHP